MSAVQPQTDGVKKVLPEPHVRLKAFLSYDPDDPRLTHHQAASNSIQIAPEASKYLKRFFNSPPWCRTFRRDA
jgi:hypothetical protein